MRSSLLALSVSMAAVAAVLGSGTTSAVTKASAAPTAMQWTDDFSSQPDGPFTGTAHFPNADGNTAIKDGALALSVTQSPDSQTAMTGAMVNSKGKHTEAFGRLDVVMKTATSEPGIVNAIYLLGDNHDEVGFNLIGKDDRSIQTDYRFKGELDYNHESDHPVDHAASVGFHTYSLVTTPETLIWQVDGKTLRTLEKADVGTRFPTGPFSIYFSAWCGGCAPNSPDMVEWAGGAPNQARAPFTAYIKSVTYTPAP